VDLLNSRVDYEHDCILSHLTKVHVLPTFTYKVIVLYKIEKIIK